MRREFFENIIPLKNSASPISQRQESKRIVCLDSSSINEKAALAIILVIA